MIDILAAQEARKGKEITQIGLITSDDNPAHGLSKVKDNAALASLLQSRVDICVTQKWIVRNFQAFNRKCGSADVMEGHDFWSLEIDIVFSMDFLFFQRMFSKVIKPTLN